MKIVEKYHIIKEVEPGSIAEELELEPGDKLLSINDNLIEDVFDYHFYVNDSYLTILVEKKNGEEWELEIEKDYEEDLGVVFDEGLMDKYRSCCNKCVFCFIDQMPPGMRETLYFKDDDARLSFLQGNYITLTNMKEKDIERIILYKLSPINISVHTTNPELRCKMLHNRFAGDALKHLKRFYENQIEMNSQIVLCKGLNDGKELERSIEELVKYYPYMQSLSVVPVGLTKYREGLEPLEKFGKEDSIKVVELIQKYQNKYLQELGTRFVHASDEWFIVGELPIPEEDYYEGYGQIENGVGMVRSLIDEVHEEINQAAGDNKRRELSLATGKLAAPILQELVEEMKKKYPHLEVYIYPIRNDFFGEDITVAGLITGQDILAQLTGEKLGDYLLLPDVMLRSGECVLLDDLTVDDLENALQIPIRIVQSDGTSFFRNIIDYNSAGS